MVAQNDVRNKSKQLEKLLAAQPEQAAMLMYERLKRILDEALADEAVCSNRLKTIQVTLAATICAERMGGNLSGKDLNAIAATLEKIGKLMAEALGTEATGDDGWADILADIDAEEVGEAAWTPRLIDGDGEASTRPRAATMELVVDSGDLDAELDDILGPRPADVDERVLVPAGKPKSVMDEMPKVPRGSLPMAGAGRCWHPEWINWALDRHKDGWSNIRIAGYSGVGKSTIPKWLKKYRNRKKIPALSPLWRDDILPQAKYQAKALAYAKKQEERHSRNDR